MVDFLNTRAKTGRTFLVLAGLVIVLAIAFLTWNVRREIAELSSASSDNVQWSLSQTEVEFQEFSNRIRVGADLAGIRRRFDIFYSRIETVSTAQVFEELRKDEDFAATLSDIKNWLDTTVPYIDATDVELTASIPRLMSLVQDIRPSVRKLSNSGLNIFARNADAQRADVASTLTELALALAALIGALGLAVVYLFRLNKQMRTQERSQRQTGARMNTVINTSLDGVIISDDRGYIMEFSPAAEEIFGHKAADVIGHELGAIIVPDHLRAGHDAGMERMRQGGERRVVGKGRVQLEAKRSDGTVFPVELAIQSAVTEAGDIFIAFLRDITQQKADEAELVDARDKAIAGEKSRSEFLATMSHEIRTPLNGLLGNLSLLRDTTLTGKQDTYMRNMETSGRLLLSHVSDVLDITRYDSGKVSANLQPMNVSDLLQDIIDNQSGMAANQETALDWGWDGPAQHWISSDCDRLQHVLMNLIGNAVKFTKRGRVSVTVSWHNDEISFEIEDTGVGIPDELQDRIFEDFVTGNAAYDREVGGTGLGLSIAKRFIDMLGGDIMVASTLGIGSTFRVTVPAKATSEPAKAGNLIERRAVVTPQRVLVVEDNEINRFVVREMLQADGHEVHEAHDGQQGVDMAQADNYDLILMDISMPVLDGRSATRLIRQGHGASKKTRIVALTANAMPSEREDFLANGMDDVLTKPLKKSDLRIALGQKGHEPMTEASALIDEAHTLETYDVIGAENFPKLLGRYNAEVEHFIEWLQGDERLDRNDIAAEAHKIAGNAALFGATGFRDVLLKLENAAKAGEDAVVMSAITTLPDLWKDSKKALTEITLKE
ncbi:Sensory box histidine kinase/response regulator [Sulfitobacter noctilucicola]|uniref:histidine kinase n=1 Tax=Sulfitobacter noctilucicola TaxID=1342301 RepID=A0A7W6Q616_9RHOB|nr:ATP-binding protein [Sulfitobacter noctilucicola]KIN64486.1 Sensory box histidine kinase/response regulator [Sulfitobacter noctilucicola]MBB4174355.1 PAS domain S-box-containing protein [Sulfitobacter noctilucicola]